MIARAALRLLLLALASAVPAWCQFELFLVNGAIEQPVPRVFDLGVVEPGASVSVPFRLRNFSNTAATLDYLSVNGSSFVSPAFHTLSLNPQQAYDFTVLFQSAGTGRYSAALDTVGISILLTANVPAELTYQLDTGAGMRSLAAAPVDFGTVDRGASAMRHILLLNHTSGALTVPEPLITGAGFARDGASPGGTLLQPTESIALDVQFAPTIDGLHAGLLTLGDRIYALTGAAVEPPLPRPRVVLTFPQPGSAQQGSVTVNLDAPSKTSGSGTVSLTFLPLPGGATDSGITFATAGQSATFTVQPGDTQGHFGAQLTAPFQTGTTAGTMNFTVLLGGLTDQQSIIILPAKVGVTTAQGLRSTGVIEVDLTGFDNTRTAGALTFTFFDAAGTAIVPGPIRSDAAASFAAYFQSAPSGSFTLKAVFPVAGDASQIKAFEAVVTNSAGTATTARTNF